MMELHELSALELGQMLARRQVSAPEATQAALDRIGRYEPELNAFITIDDENAMAAAKAVQKRLDSGELLPALAGVPLAVKDNISTRGTRTTCASRMLWNYTPPFDATVIERMRDCAAVILGKTNMDEFAMGSTSETSYAGAVHNPWAPSRVPGGSSGGSAAAVAAGEAWYALGSDTGGSIRQPCSFCGLTGLKPTYGSVSRYGLVAFASSLDQIGPIGRTAADCAAILAMFAGPDRRDSTCMPKNLNLDPDELIRAVRTTDDLRGIRIGMPEEYFTSGLQADSRRAILAAADQLALLGARLETFSLSLADEAIPAYYLIATAEASANLARYDGIQYGYRPDDDQVKDLDDFYCQARTAGFGREVRRRILLGTFALSAGYYDAYYLKAMKVRQMISDSMRGVLGRYDLILSPTSPSTAPRLGESLDDPLKMYLSDIYTVTANLAGLPALTLPCGLDADGLPIGFQLTGRAFDDARLLGIGAAFQKVTSHHLKRPDLQEVAA
jgi:aspartyl-tRNA(Asn)/glutamyl-tRNA(Gln) amidotransferase subunit A